MLASFLRLHVLCAAATMAHAEKHQAPIVLTIARSDSGGGDGMQADLKTFEAHGVFGTTAVVALTAQNTKGVQAEEDMPLSIVHAQISSVLSDMGARVVKIGTLSTVKLIHAVNATLAKHRTAVHVIDPDVTADSNAMADSNEAVIEAIRDVLVPMATVLTPNVYEAGQLLGRAAPT